MLIQLAFLAATLAPQDPGTTPEAPPPIPFARALPEATLFVAHLGDLSSQEADLEQTSLVKLINAIPWPDEAKAGPEKMMAQLRQVTGLDDATLKSVVRHGVTIAVTEIEGTGMPEFVVAANLVQDPAIYQRALERAARENGADAYDYSGTQVWSLNAGGDMHPAVAVHRGHLLASTSQSHLHDAMDRLGGSSENSLADHPDFRATLGSPAQSDQPVLSVFARTDLLIRHLMSRVSGTSEDQIRKAIKALGPQDVRAVGYSVALEANDFVDHLRIVYPEPRTGLLGALVGPGTALDTRSAELVPPGVSSFSLSHVDLLKIYHEVIALAKAVDPTTASMMTGGVRSMAKRSGVDIENDLLANLGHLFATLQWPSDDEVPHMAFLLACKDTWRFEKALSNLFTSMGMQPKSRTWNGHSVYGFEFGGPDFTLTYAFANNHVVVATSEPAMRSSLIQLNEPAQNHGAVHTISRMPIGSTAAAWSDIGPMFRSAFDRGFVTAGAPPDVVETMRSVLSQLNGEMHTFVTTDPQGISIRTRSSLGNVVALGGIAVVSAIALPNLMAERNLAMPSANQFVEPGNDVKLAIERIRDAEREATRGPKGHYVDLDQLVDAGHIAPEFLGSALGHGRYQRGDYVLEVMLPEDPVDRGLFYALMAWPADGSRGTVLAATPTEPLLVNRAIAAAQGMQTVASADLFLTGHFGTGFAPGWRESTERAVVAAAPQQQDRDLMAAVLAAEAAGSTPVPDTLLDALQSSHPQVAARAAWTLGKLKAIENVPQLCEAVQTHESMEVRQHAMAALRSLKDPRSIQTSIAVLSSDDVLLRAMAAENLGVLQAREAINPLLEVIARDPDDDDRDRAAAVLALTDLGAAEVLLPAASAITTEEGRVGSSMAYMFQTLSPALGSEEPTVLMAVLDHPSAVLRRYAIQRLGELRDPATVAALEGQLGSEDDGALRPLIEVSLQAIRGGTSGAEEPTPLADVSSWWKDLGPTERAAIAAAGGAFGVLLFAFFFVRSRRRRARMAEDWAAFTAPSEDFGDEPVDEEFEYYEEDDETVYAGVGDEEFADQPEDPYERQ